MGDGVSIEESAESRAAESAARYAASATERRLRRERGEFITKAELDKIVVLWRQPDTLALWGIPYSMRDECQQTPYDLWKSSRGEGYGPTAPRYRANLSDWIWLGSPGWWGGHLPESRITIQVWLAPLAILDLIPRDECAFVDLQKAFGGKPYDQAIWGKAPSVAIAD